jgi:hypothetical protein
MEDQFQEVLNSAPYVHIIPTTDSSGNITPIPVSLGSGSITVSASITNTQLEISNDIGNPIPVLISGSLIEFTSSISNFPETQKITGSVNILNALTASIVNFPAIQEVTGSFLTNTELRSTPILISASILPLPEGASTEAKQDSEILEIQKVVKNTIKFYTEDVEEDTSTFTTYVGKQSVDEQWMIQKIVDTIVGTTTTTSLQYATVVNNSGILDYADAWADRATLTYSEIKNLL